MKINDIHDLKKKDMLYTSQGAVYIQDIDYKNKTVRIVNALTNKNMVVPFDAIKGLETSS